MHSKFIGRKSVVDNALDNWILVNILYLLQTEQTIALPHLMYQEDRYSFN